MRYMVGKVVVMVPVAMIPVAMVPVVKVPVEIAQDEEAAEAEPSPPEWPGDPIIKITVCPGRRIVAHDGRSILVIVLVNIGGLHIIGILRTRSGVA
jgi:hypothetical protein